MYDIDSKSQKQRSFSGAVSARCLSGRSPLRRGRIPSAAERVVRKSRRIHQALDRSLPRPGDVPTTLGSPRLRRKDRAGQGRHRRQRPRAGAELSAGFLHIYGTELLPPLTVLEAGPELSTIVEFDTNGEVHPRKWKLGVGGGFGVSGLIGYAKATRKLEVLDLTQSDPEPIYAAQGGGRRDVHFCFDSALLTPAARQRIRIVSALWRPFLTSPRSTMSIVGYADKAGTEVYNLKLSEQRAENTLTAFHDVLGSAFAVKAPTTTGMGEAGARAEAFPRGRPTVVSKCRWTGLPSSFLTASDRATAASGTSKRAKSTRLPCW